MILGRIYRAQMRMDAALAEQDAALAKSPGNPIARLERGLLAVRRYDALMETLREAWAASVSTRAAGRPGIAGRGPKRADLETPDSERWRERALADLRGLQDPIAVALVAWLEGRPSTALFETAASTSPETEEAFEWRARIAREERRFDDAVRWYGDGIERDRGYVPYRTGRAAVLGERAHRANASGADGSADYAAGIADLDAAVTLAPDDPTHRVRRALLLSNAAIAMAARGLDSTDLDAAARLQPDSAALLRGRGSMLGNWARSDQVRGVDASARYEQAIADSMRAVELDRGNHDGWFTLAVCRLNLAGLLFDLGRSGTAAWRAALSDLDEAILRRANLPELWHVRGYARARAVDYLEEGVETYLDMAVADFSEALRLDRTHDDALLQRGDTLSLLADRRGTGLEAAERDFAAAQKISPGRDEVWNRSGWFQLQCAFTVTRRGGDASSHRRAAFECYDKAVALNPGRDENWTGRARARSALQMDNERVLADFRKATGLNPGRSEAWFYQGAHLSQLGARLQNEGRDPAEAYAPALEALGHAATVQPGNGHSWILRAEVRQNWGLFLAGKRVDPLVHFRDAVVALTGALVRRSNRKDLHERRGRVRWDIGVWLRDSGKESAQAWGEAAEDLAEAARRAPEKPDILLMCAKARYQQGLDLKRRGQNPTIPMEASIADFSALIRGAETAEAFGGRANARGNLAGWRVNHGKDALDLATSAVEDFDQGLRLKADAPEFLRDRGSARCVLCQAMALAQRDPRPALDAAVADLDRAVALAPRDPLAVEMRGLAHLMRGIAGNLPAEYRAAIADFEKAIELNPAARTTVAPKIADAKRRLGE